MREPVLTVAAKTRTTKDGTVRVLCGHTGCTARLGFVTERTEGQGSPSVRALWPTLAERGAGTYRGRLNFMAPPGFDGYQSAPGEAAEVYSLRRAGSRTTPRRPLPAHLQTLGGVEKGRTGIVGRYPSRWGVTILCPDCGWRNVVSEPERC